MVGPRARGGCECSRGRTVTRDVVAMARPHEPRKRRQIEVFFGTGPRVSTGKKMRRQLILVCLLHFAPTSLVLAQTATGVIRGTVQDSTGAVVVDAHVLLIDQARNQSWEQTTTGEGSFEFRGLPIGNYRVELDHPGFIAIVRMSRPRRADCQLQRNVAGRFGRVRLSSPTVNCRDLRRKLCLKSPMTSGLWACRSTAYVMQLVSLWSASSPEVVPATQRRPTRPVASVGARQHVGGPGRRHEISGRS